MKAFLTGLTPATIAVVGTLALSACPEQKQPTQPTQPMAPASRPAEPPAVKTPTTAPSGALDRGMTPKTRDQIDSDGIIRRGLALSTSKSLTVAECLGNVSSLTGAIIKVTGTIESVCQEKGCWFIIQGATPAERIRITAKDYKFFVPSSVIGKAAVVEGALSTRTLSPIEAQHLEDEGGAAPGQARKVEGPTSEIAIAAVALEVTGRS